MHQYATDRKQFFIFGLHFLMFRLHWPCSSIHSSPCSTELEPRQNPATPAAAPASVRSARRAGRPAGMRRQFTRQSVCHSVSAAGRRHSRRAAGSRSGVGRAPVPSPTQPESTRPRAAPRRLLPSSVRQVNGAGCLPASAAPDCRQTLGDCHTSLPHWTGAQRGDTEVTQVTAGVARVDGVSPGGDTGWTQAICG